jgi:Helix-turn-helix domain
MGKANRTGRSNKKDRYVALPHYMMDTFAWQRLSVTARAAWLEFVRLHNGANNGKLALSSRTLGKRLGVSKDTAVRAIKELLTFGFLQMTKAASFIIKRRAAEYLLTHIPDDRTEPKCPPSRAFQNIGKAVTV